MQKRSSTTGWLLYLLITVVIILIVLTMYQIDRQWNKLAAVQAAMSEQAKDIRELRTALSSGVVRQSGGAGATASVSPAFQRAEAMTQQADYAQGDWSVDAFGTNLKTLTPLVSTDAYASDVQSYVLEGLITRNPDTLEWEGLIAKSWQVSPDGLTITFQMRDDVTFSDGVALTADDVA
ncbi:MAG: ABC transporter substrate-binding protein, partial [Thiothrix litoralis]